MSLLDEVKEIQKNLRILRADQRKINILTTLIGEATAIGKNDGNRETTDSEVIGMIKKFINNINETNKLVGENEDREVEIDTLSCFLPPQMEDIVLEKWIDYYIKHLNVTSVKQMGVVIKELKLNWDGSYDAKKASEIIKKKLTGE